MKVSGFGACQFVYDQIHVLVPPDHMLLFVHVPQSLKVPLWRVKTIVALAAPKGSHPVQFRHKLTWFRKWLVMQMAMKTPVSWVEVVCVILPPNHSSWNFLVLESTTICLSHLNLTPMATSWVWKNK